MIPVNKIDLLNNVARNYHRIFKKHKEGRKYLESRGINGNGLCERFGVGYANGSIFDMIPDKGEIREALKSIGILTSRGREFFKGYVVFPVFNRNNDCVEIYGRRVIPQKGKPEHLYLPGRHKGVWNWQALTMHRSIILTKGIIDALSIYQSGHTEVISLYGKTGFTEDHKKLFKIYKPAKVYLALGNERACQSVAEILGMSGISCYQVIFPDDTDANEYLKTHSKDEFKKVLEESQPVKVDMPGTGGKVSLTADRISFEFGGRKYQVRDLREGDTRRMRVNIRALNNGSFYIDTFDLYVSKTRRIFANSCARLYKTDSEVIEKELCVIINRLENIDREKQGKEPEENEPEYVMTEDEQEEAIEFLKKPNLLDLIVRHLEVCGYVGEEINKKIGYLIAVSRKLSSPLSGVIISNAGAGKSKLMEHLASFVPDEDITFYTRITPQALYYKSERSLKHKLIITCEEEGILGANYSIRELISSKVLRMAAPLKDPVTGKMKTVEYEVEGPVSLLFSTTSAEINYENATRCFILCLDESREQTKRVQVYHRRNRTIEGIKKKMEAGRIKKLHKNAQRCLKQLLVINPYADDLTFPDRWLQSRREQEKYLSLIDTIALLHQYQRTVKVMEYGDMKVEYIEVTIEDIEQANILMTEILGQTLSELKKPSRELLMLTKKMVDEKCVEKQVSQADFKFNRRDIREYTGWSDYQVRTHIKQLEELEYILPVIGNRGKMYKYELAYEGTGESEKFISGLTDVKKLRKLEKLRG